MEFVDVQDPDSNPDLRWVLDGIGRPTLGVGCEVPATEVCEPGSSFPGPYLIHGRHEGSDGCEVRTSPSTTGTFEVSSVQ